MKIQDIIVIAVLSMLLVGGYYLTHHKAQKVVKPKPVVNAVVKPVVTPAPAPVVNPVVVAPFTVTPVAPVAAVVAPAPVVTPKPATCQHRNRGLFPHGTDLPIC